MRDHGVHTPERQRLRRVLRLGVGGLAVGGLAGYLAALVLPRRFPAAGDAYRAPVPASSVPEEREDASGVARGCDVRGDERTPAGTA